MTKLAQSYAVMAAVSHEINDDLTIILSAAQMLCSRLDDDIELAADVRAAATRAAWRVSNLQTFAARNGIRAPRMSAAGLMDPHEP